MGNEMGNNNVSGIKEEEKAGVEVSERAEAAVPTDEIKGENHVIPEDQNKDFHAKADLSSNGLSAAYDLDAERLKSDEQALVPEKGDEESKHHSPSPEASTESDDSSSQHSYIQESALPDEGNYEKPLDSNLQENISSSDILQIRDQPSNGKESIALEVERSDSTESKTTSQPSKTSNHSTRSLEDFQHLLPNQSEKVPKKSETCNLQEKGNTQEGIDREENVDDLVSGKPHFVEGESLEMETSKEKCDIKSTENKFGDSLEDQGDGEMALRMNLSEFSDSSNEDVLQYSSLDPSFATPEPQEKRIVHPEEIDLISIKPEKGEGKQESNEINSSKKTVNELIIDNAAPLMNLPDASSKENGEEVMVQLSSNSGLTKVNHTGEVTVTHKRSKSVLTGNKRCVSVDQFEDTEEVITMLPTITSVWAQLSPTDKYDEERVTKKTSVDKTDKREDVSSSIEMNNDNKGTAEKCISGSESCKLGSNLLKTYSVPELNSQNGTETLLGSEAAEDRKKCTVIDLQEILVTATSNLDPQKATMQNPATNIQTTSRTSAETEGLSYQSNEHNPPGEISLPNGKAQESSALLNSESKPGNQLQRSKSPSFDFGLQLDARSVDSDQTPLLHHDKTAARSFSGFTNIRYQNRIIQTDYSRISLDFEPVTVEEKTIRMERSDSDISRASFMKLLKKDEKGNAEFSPQKQENPVANNNSEELSTEELALTSLEGSGKRKNRPSIFTSCICCAAVIH